MSFYDINKWQVVVNTCLEVFRRLWYSLKCAILKFEQCIFIQTKAFMKCNYNNDLQKYAGINIKYR